MMKFKTAIAAAAVGVLLLATAGCGWFPWVLNALAKPEKVEPVCTVPPDVKLLVYVHDLELSDTIDCAAIKRDLTDSINEMMLANEVVAEVVPYEDLLDFMADEPTFYQKSFGQIGTGLDAQLVLYVRLKRFKLQDTEVALLWHGELDVLIKLVDLDNQTLWPTDSPSGYPVDRVDISRDREEFRSYGVKLTEELAAAMAGNITRLFYEHEVPAGTKTRRERQEENQDLDF